MKANDRLHDGVVLRIIETIRAANGETSALVNGIMREADDRMLARLIQIDNPGTLTPKQLAGMEQRLRNALAVQERRMRKRLAVYLDGIAGTELQAMEMMLREILAPTGTKIKLATEAQAAALARRTPINGVSIGRMVQRFFRNDRERVLATLRDGVTRGLTTAELGRAIVGSASRRRLDGVRQVSRRGAATMVESLTTHAATAGRETSALRNDDLIKFERWVATLDRKTCPVCGVRDGKVFPVGKGPKPPAHPRCRCARMPIIPNLRIDETQPGVRPVTVADFDGSGPEVLTYSSWLKRQKTKVQREVLGPSRFALWETGDIELSAFVNDRGSVLTLQELKLRIPSVFNEAGLNDD